MTRLNEIRRDVDFISKNPKPRMNFTTIDEKVLLQSCKDLLSLIDRMALALEGTLRPISSTSIIKAEAILKEVE